MVEGRLARWYKSERKTCIRQNSKCRYQKGREDTELTETKNPEKDENEFRAYQGRRRDDDVFGANILLNRECADY